MASNTSKVVALSLAQLVTTVVTVVSGMVFTRYLSIADYATYLQTFLAYDFVSPLLTLGLPSALFYFLPRAEERQKGLVIDNMLLLFICGLIFSLFLILGGTELLAQRFKNPKLNETLRWMIFFPLYTFPVVLGAILVVKDKVRLNAIYNIITGAVILAAITTQHYEVPILVRIFLPLLFFPIILYLSFKYVPGQWEGPSISSMVRMLKFAIPLGFAAILGSLTMQLANVIVSSLCNPEEFAIYTMGAREVPLVGIITGSISIVIMSEMSLACKKGNKQVALELFRKSSILSACFLLPVMCFLLIYAKEFIIIMLSDKYVESVLPFQIYLFFLPVRIVNYGAAFIALGKSKSVLYRSFWSLIITGILCVLFIYLWGAIGAALATIITSYLFAVPYNLYSLGKSFECSPLYVIPFKRIGVIFIVSFIALLFSSIFLFFDNLTFLTRFILGGIFFFGVYIGIAYVFIPEFKEVVYLLRRRYC